MVRQLNWQGTEKEGIKSRFSNDGEGSEISIFDVFQENIKVRFSDTTFQDDFDSLNNTDWNYTNSTASNSYVIIPSQETFISTATQLYRTIEFINVNFATGLDGNYIGVDGGDGNYIYFYTSFGEIKYRTSVASSVYSTGGTDGIIGVLSGKVGRGTGVRRTTGIYNLKIIWKNLTPTVTNAIFYTANAGESYTKAAELSAPTSGCNIYVTVASGDSVSFDKVKISYSPVYSMTVVSGFLLDTDELDIDVLGSLGGYSFEAESATSVTTNAGKNQLRNYIASGAGGDNPDWLAIATGEQSFTEESTNITGIQVAVATYTSNCYNTGETTIWFKIPTNYEYDNLTTVGLYTASGSGTLWNATTFPEKDKVNNIEWIYAIPMVVTNA